MGFEKNFVLVIVVMVYVALIAWKKRRTEALWVGVLALLVGRVLSPGEAIHAVEWNVLGIFAGILFVAEVFADSGVPLRIADLLIDRAKTVGGAILIVCLFSGFVSIFVENVATVLIVAPVAMEVSRRAGVSPLPFLIGIAVSSNLQGAGTLIGDPPSMILASFQRMNFNDFFFYQGKLSIFWSVQVGALASAVVLWLIFRGHRQPVAFIEPAPVKSWLPTVAIVVMVVLLALSPIFDPGFHWLGGTICMVIGLGLVAWEGVREKGKSAALFRRFDWNTTAFLIGVFVLVEAMVHAGLIDDLAAGFASVTGDSPLVIYVSLVVFSVAVSAFVDNIPFITVMIPLVKEVATGVGTNEVPLIFGMVLGASLGGNITPFGASANVVAVGLLRKQGITVSTRDFLKIGLPFTLVATAAGAAFLWLTW
ncbi:MAG: arsenic transporter [Gemmatimonadota bacterium]|nr:MAG: arsenic transporter [Gemmatimonadota bacterium]